MGMETEVKISIITFDSEHMQQCPFWAKLKWENMFGKSKKRKKKRKKKKKKKLNSLISFDQLKKSRLSNGGLLVYTNLQASLLKK